MAFADAVKMEARDSLPPNRSISPPSSTPRSSTHSTMSSNTAETSVSSPSDAIKPLKLSKPRATVQKRPMNVWYVAEETAIDEIGIAPISYKVERRLRDL